jgi:hypothetical protein
MTNLDLQMANAENAGNRSLEEKLMHQFVSPTLVMRLESVLMAFQAEHSSYSSSQ